MKSPAERRLKNLKRLLWEEQTSASPSQAYVDDLKLSIERLELTVDAACNYMMVK